MLYSFVSRSLIDTTCPRDMFVSLKKSLNIAFTYVFIDVLEYIELSAIVISMYDSFVESNTESVSRYSSALYTGAAHISKFNSIGST